MPEVLKIETIKEEMMSELRSILCYWMDNTIDLDRGGFVGARNHDNLLIPRAEKGAVLNTRILWTFSSAYHFCEDPQYLKIADRAYQYLVAYFLDTVHGGLYWSLNEDGSVANKRKQIYAQGFGIYGFSEYYKRSGNKNALLQAVNLFELIERYSFDSKYGGYVEALSEDWKPMQDMRLSPKDANDPKSMNTHLHILEAYTNLFRVWKDERLKAKIHYLIRLFLDRIIDSKTHHFQLFFDYDWTVHSSIISYGHDIEGAWLMAEAAYELGDESLIKEVEAMSLKMVDAVLDEGMLEDGSVYNELVKGHLDSDKHWWPQAEAMVGLVYAWKISGKEEYLETMHKTWNFIKKHIIDTTNGEWFWRVDKNGIPITSEDKVGFWKCPYHNSRALMEVMTNLKMKG